MSFHRFTTMSTFTATISHPLPRKHADGIDGLYHFVRRTLAPLGIVITKFYAPTYPETRDGGVNLVHLKFDFMLEDASQVQHCADFRLANDSLSFRKRITYAEQMMARMNEFADAEAAYYAKDKETRGAFKEAVSVRALEVVHTPGASSGASSGASATAAEEGEVRRKEGYWKMKLIRPRAAAVVVRNTTPLFR